MGHADSVSLGRFPRRCGARWRVTTLAAPRRWTGWAIGLMVGFSLAVPRGFTQQDTVDFFRDRCTSCHTIGGGARTGPDLKDVTKRQERAWLVKFIMNPQAVISSGDPYAQQILESARGVVMAPIPGMTQQRAERLLDLIEAESLLEESQFKGIQVSNTPFTSQDRQLGRDYFFGYAQLENGAPPCLSCHSIRGTSALGGGQLGPEMTKVYERLNGRDALSGWLAAPATATMQPLFQKHSLTSEEIHALVAFFADAAPQEESASTASRIAFLLLGLAGAAGLIFACDAIWKYRFHSVRRNLVDTTP